MPPEISPLRGGALTRRRVLRLGWLGAAGALVAGWLELAGARRRRRAARLTLAVPGSDGVSFHGEVILVSAGGQLAALHARCPHLGCTIARAVEGVLVCPCHGSRFDAAGRRLGGPAPSDLTPLRLTARRDGKVDVDLPA